MTVDDALADRLERALADAGSMRGVELERVAGNPLAVEHRMFDRLRARLVGTDLAHYPYFSGPLGIGSTDVAVVPELVDWCTSNGTHRALSDCPRFWPVLICCERYQLPGWLRRAS